jgi:hypothetical protein
LSAENRVSVGRGEPDGLFDRAVVVDRRLAADAIWQPYTDRGPTDQARVASRMPRRPTVALLAPLPSFTRTQARSGSAPQLRALPASHALVAVSSPCYSHTHLCRHLRLLIVHSVEPLSQGRGRIGRFDLINALFTMAAGVSSSLSCSSRDLSLLLFLLRVA